DAWATDRQPDAEEIRSKLARPNSERVWYLRYAMKAGFSMEEIFELTNIDPWFLDQLKELVEFEEEVAKVGTLHGLDPQVMRTAKQYGYSDRQLAHLLSSDEMEVRSWRKDRGIVATFKSVDTCAAEFEAYTPYYYSTYESEDETPAKGDQKRIIILGGGPNRIGQGIEFDYCCCHASYALREMGIQSVMVNSNPETVSTDYDTSDILFFEPLTTEDVLNICDRVQPDGVIVQFGGQTPLNLARGLATAGVPIIGTSVETIEAAEDREKFQQLLMELKLKQPANGIARNLQQARTEAQKIGFPSLVRPSYVLGGRAMEICYDHTQFDRFVAEAFVVAQGQPVLIDRFLEDATEVDVDAVSDGEDVVIMGIMEHIEEAGVHSGDSACVIPPYSLTPAMLAEIKEATRAMAQRLRVVGLMNVQFAIKDDGDGPVLYVLEVNPRASRTVPFVAKATGVPVAKIAAKVMAGESLKKLGITDEPIARHVSVKEAVFPFRKFAGVDIVLGPEMRSTGEVMGVSENLAIAFAKSQLAAGVILPREGNIFLSISSRHKGSIGPMAEQLHRLGYKLLATSGTALEIEKHQIPVTRVRKLAEGNPNLIDYLKNEDVSLIINTPNGKGARTDEGRIRAAAVQFGVPCITTIDAGFAAIKAMEALRHGELTVCSLQERFAKF
ncbi:MAG: carbamoyl-phosphate synthase large subunit, partial [Pirellulales bacterium]